MRQVGSVASYGERENDDYTHQYFAVLWHKTVVKSFWDYETVRQYFEEIPEDECVVACWGWLEPEKYAELEAKMAKVRSQITGSPWFQGKPIIDETPYGGADVEIALKDNLIKIKNWAFTCNSVQYNMSNPAQAYNTMQFLYNEGVTSVDFKVKKLKKDGTVDESRPSVAITINHGQTVSMGELGQFFNFGPLPQPVLTQCTYEEGVPERIWPSIENVVNEKYPWRAIGESVDLLFEVVKVHCEEIPESSNSSGSSENDFCAKLDVPGTLYVNRYESYKVYVDGMCSVAAEIPMYATDAPFRFVGCVEGKDTYSLTYAGHNVDAPADVAATGHIVLEYRKDGNTFLSGSYFSNLVGWHVPIYPTSEPPDACAGEPEVWMGFKTGSSTLNAYLYSLPKELQ